jgi:hypothetical protein
MPGSADNCISVYYVGWRRAPSPHSLWNDEDLLRTIGSVVNLERKCNHARSMPVRTMCERL